MQSDQDLVTILIRHCLQGQENADRLFKKLITENSRQVTVDGREVTLNEDERSEFVERFSSEVEPTLWESKRRKDQL